MAYTFKKLYVTSKRDKAAAMTCAAELHVAAKGNDAVAVQTPFSDPMVLPPTVAQLLAKALTFMAMGQSFRIESLPEEVGSIRAAKMLGMSHDRLKTLLDDGWLPFRTVGNRRRIFLRDLAPKLR
jgi:hypothetical protein